eukprot:jgi/Orpsp1_1/1188474/evm.model.d7180000065132.1
MVYDFIVYTELYNALTNDFNQYSKKNNLDIKLEMILFTESNSTTGRDTYSSTIDAYLQKKSNTFDLYVYDPIFTRRFSSHFLDLKEWVEDDHLKLFMDGDAYQLSSYNGKLVSLPIFIKYKVLYSNMKYLNMYGKEVPKTWDDLIETSEFILKKERLKNNTSLIGYNGLFPDNENTVCSIYEFIYSFRNTKTSPMPEFNSKEALEALYKLDEVKNRVSSDATFKSDEFYNMQMIFGGNILFSTLWDGMDKVVTDYKISALPGKKKGVNGSCLGGFNIGISKYINDEQKDAALKVLKFFTSKEEQKRIIKKFNVISTITSIYDDDEFCEDWNCELPKEVQGINRPCDQFENYEPYALEFIEKFFKFLYNGQSAESVLIEIDDITRIHSFNIDTSPLSLILFISLVTSFVIVFLSSFIIFVPYFKNHFTNFELGITHSIGSLLVIISEFMCFGELSGFKCFMKHCLVSIGFIMIFISLLYKLLINFPEVNKYSEWIRKNKYLYVCVIIFFEIFINLLLLISPYTVEDILIENGKNFNKCKISKVGLIITIIQVSIKIIFYFGIIFLIFLEWNMKETLYYIRNLVFFMSMDGLMLILYTIISSIQLNDYIFYNTLHICLILLFTLTNHNYMFIIRIIIEKLSKGKNEQEVIIDKLLNFNNQTSCNTSIIGTSATEKSDTKSEAKSNKSKYSSKLLSYHYATSPNSSTTNDTSQA